MFKGFWRNYLKFGEISVMLRIKTKYDRINTKISKALLDLIPYFDISKGAPCEDLWLYSSLALGARHNWVLKLIIKINSKEHS